MPNHFFINGQWATAESGEERPVINPATENPVAQVPWGGRADAARAVAAAAAALPHWRKQTAWERAAILKRTADLIREQAHDIARCITQEQGKPLAEALGETAHAADEFEWFAEEGKRAEGRVIPAAVAGKRHLTLKHPVGVVGAITPWNFPAALIGRKVAPALAAGCTIVIKPAEQTPLTAIRIFACLQAAGLPDGVANLVWGDAPAIGQEFLQNSHVRKLSFTGSTAVGKLLMRGCADQIKRVSLELGGHAPFIVLPDVDPEVAARVAVQGKFRNNGQVCIAPSRFFVHDRIRKDFTEAAVERARALRQGDGLTPGVDLGPVIDERMLAKTTGLVEDARSKGGQVLTGGSRSAAFSAGYFYEPTILTNLASDSRLLTEEPFAPVLPILDFSDLDQVIARANSTPYGLSAYVFTNDLDAMWRLAEGLEVGIIGVNDPVPTAVQCPFGGMKESGLGRELGHDGLEAFLETKYVSFKTSA